jgi:hypothetical protein
MVEYPRKCAHNCLRRIESIKKNVEEICKLSQSLNGC